MTDFSIRSDAVDVEQIMRQIRARIREKRGVDYTEDEIRELAAVKLERFLDPHHVRSDLVEHYRQRKVLERTEPPPNFEFDESSPYVSSRGFPGRILTAFRRLCRPFVKLIFNPTPIVHALTLQSRINEFHSPAARHELDTLNYEVLNNLVVEVTRLGIEMRNIRMRVESLSSRLDFDERRARALEQAVQYRPVRVSPATAATGTAETQDADASPEGPARRRRRRRGRRRPDGGRRPGSDSPGGSETAASAEDPAGRSGRDTPASGDRQPPGGTAPTVSGDGGGSDES